LEYKPKHITIRNAAREILFTMRIEGSSEVFVAGKIYYFGKAIIANDDDILINEVPHFGRIKNCVFEIIDTAIRLQI
jgi:hypothetical protein